MDVMIDLVAALYGWDWAVEVERQTFLHRLNAAAHPHFRWHVEPPPAPTELTLEMLDAYTKSLDQDFRRFQYTATSFACDPGAVLVAGSLAVVAFSSGESFTRPFSHRWRQRQGILVDVRPVRHPSQRTQLHKQGSLF